MKLTVIAHKLNIRSSIPSSFSDKSSIVGTLIQGRTIEATPVTDIPNPALGTWYKDENNHYYWGGGVQEIINNSIPISNSFSTSLSHQFDPNRMSWGHRWCNIPFIWDDMKTMGEGVTVAVIDSGIDISNLDLAPNIHPKSTSFIGETTLITDIDGHGTQMAGIIGGKGISKIYGVSPNANLLIFKATNYSYGVDIESFIKALNAASLIPEIDIISVSYVLNDDVNLKLAVQNCITAGKIIVAPVGNSRDFHRVPNGPDKDTYPACYDNVLAVGAFDQNGQICRFSNWNLHLSIVAPGDYNILTTGINNTSVMSSGTSIATAFTSGCLALMLSYAKINSIPPHNCVQAILGTCDDTGPAIGRDIQTGYGRMNIRNAFNKIKII